MRFRFCGDQDCPDWVLAEIATLTRITSIKMRMLSTQVLQHILGGQIDYEKVKKLTADANFESGDIKASIAVLTFILTSAAKYAVEEDVLSDELQQLGLQREHASALCKLFAENSNNIHQQLLSQTLRVSKLDQVHWKVDYIVGSSHLKTVDEPVVHFKLQSTNCSNDAAEQHAFAVTPDKLRVLIAEMKLLYAKMEKFS